MKYVLSLVAGLVAGLATGAALLYFNPLTLGQGEPEPAAGWVLGYSLAADDTWISSHDRRLGLPVVPDDVPLLWESGIKGTLLAAMPLKDESGEPRAAASRISVPSADSEFLRAGLLVEDYWLVSVPGEGSMFVHAVNNQWPLLRDTVVRVDWLKRDWAGPGRYDPTRGPASAGAAVTGLTGRFAGAEGRGRERLSLESYSGSLARLTGELLLEVDEGQR